MRNIPSAASRPRVRREAMVDLVIRKQTGDNHR
jgi:hypothetical protein